MHAWQRNLQKQLLAIMFVVTLLLLVLASTLDQAEGGGQLGARRNGLRFRVVIVMTAQQTGEPTCDWKTKIPYVCLMVSANNIQ